MDGQLQGTPLVVVWFCPYLYGTRRRKGGVRQGGKKKKHKNKKHKKTQLWVGEVEDFPDTSLSYSLTHSSPFPTLTCGGEYKQGGEGKEGYGDERMDGMV